MKAVESSKLVKPVRRPPAAGMGRKKGSVNKTTALLKDAILAAAEAAGDKKGMKGYLTQQARDNPVAFMTLLGKVLPLQIAGSLDLTTTNPSNLTDEDLEHIAAGRRRRAAPQA